MTFVLILIALVCVIVVAVWLIFAHPMGLIIVTMFMLASMPSLQIPVIRVAVIVPLVGMCIAARFSPRWALRPSTSLSAADEVTPSPQWARLMTALLLFASAFALIANRFDAASLRDFIAWALMSSFVFPLCALRPDELVRAGRAYALGATAGATFGLALRFADPHAELLSKLSFLGYASDTAHGFVLVGASNNGTLRLTGAYLEPNIAGLIMTFGLVLALALLRGNLRIISSVLLVSAIALTFSRSALGSIFVAGALLLVFGVMSGRARRGLLFFEVLGVLAMLAVPSVRSRLTDSFTSADTGTEARTAALRNFPHEMSGHWLLGKGFGLPELTNSAVTVAKVNSIPANAPLLTVYRAGIIVGLIFLAILVVGVARSCRLLAHGSFSAAALGAGALGLILVALQLDIPVVTLSPTVAMFAIMLAFLENRGFAQVLADDDDAPQIEMGSVPIG